MSKILGRFAKGEAGATAIEYGLNALAIIAGASALGNSLSLAFNNVAKMMNAQVKAVE